MSKQTNNLDNKIITDKDDSLGFDVDWDAIEQNYKHYHRHRHHSEDESDNQSPKGNKKRSFRKNKYMNKDIYGKKKWSIKKKILIGILLFLLCLIIGIVSAFLIMYHKGQKALLNYDNLNISVPDGTDYEDGGRVIYYNGHEYHFNNNIATILFMGIDNREIKENTVAGTAGQADALYLLTYDTTNGKIKVLCLNRDTMTDISRYDEAGNYHDTDTAQLCLAYAYGDGKKLSAENQVTAVERLLYNVPINAYYSIDLSAIKILNDDIGGVTLTPEYTFGDFTKGQKVTIKGDMAEAFVRHRDISLLDDNLRRMACQRQYIDAFSNQVVSATKEDFNIPIKLYQDSSKYTVTNLDISDLSYLAPTLALKYSGIEFITTVGKYHDVAGDKFAEFKVNQKKLFETVLNIFYIQIK